MIRIGIPKSIIFTHLNRLNFSALNTKKVMTRFIIKYDSIMYFIILTAPSLGDAFHAASLLLI